MMRWGQDFVRGAVMGATLLMNACATAGLDAIAPPGEFEFTGHVVRVELEGGFWAIETDSGRKLDPTNLPAALQVSQQRVRGRAVPRPDVMSFHMWGEIVELRDVQAVQ